MEWLITALWIIGGVVLLIGLLFTTLLLYLIKKVGLGNLRTLITHLILLKKYLRYRDRFFR